MWWWAVELQYWLRIVVVVMELGLSCWLAYGVLNGVPVGRRKLVGIIAGIIGGVVALAFMAAHPPTAADVAKVERPSGQ